MSVRITGALVVEKTVKRMMAFKVEIDNPNSRVAITGLEGWLKINNELILSPLFETHSTNFSQDLFKSNQADLQHISAVGTNLDSIIFNDSKYVSELSAEIDEKGLREIENARKSDQHHAIVFKLELVVRYIKSNVRIPPLQFVPSPNDVLQRVKDNAPFTPQDKEFKIIMSATREHVP
jgi:hypothetical protein